MHVLIALLDFLIDVILLHVLQLFVDSLFLLQVTDKLLLLQCIFFRVLSFHLFLQFAAVLGLCTLASIELLLSDVFEIVRRTHVDLFIFGRRRGTSSATHVRRRLSDSTISWV